MSVTMDKIVNLCKSRGIIFPGSEIYGGMGNTWDYGPIGVEVKNNIKRAWWKRFVQENPNSYGVDAAILMNSRVWEASGHTTSFSDPQMDCKECKSRHRADNLIEAHSKGEVNPDLMTNEQMEAYIAEHHVTCPRCGNFNWTPIRQFNLMFKTSRGVTEESQNVIYLRPETAQGEFVNFQNVQRTTRAKVPFGIAQIGKAFRNEITPGNFIFRTIEFEQMEHQWFCKEGTDGEYYKEFKEKAWNFLLDLGFKAEHLRFKDHDKLAHYAKAACDIQYLFPMGWSELNGIHNRTDYDLSRHQEYSGKNMLYNDPITNEKYIPYVIEYSIGADRLMLATLSEAYDEETLDGGDTRVVMHFHPAIAAYKVAVLPLQKNLSDKAKEVFDSLSKKFMITYDDAGSIGKRYRRQDEIGTPYCVTIDFDTLEDNTVTVRDRDTMEQIRLPVSELEAFVNEKIQFN
ncbi:MAG: glycine--tRNA ligase [Clostridia bacterium]|nr:glycine--tRNA ligase [Clostridia bacterium]MBQ9480753.1 glycine--tRNA ligase [Clostridia bacterium]